MLQDTLELFLYQRDLIKLKLTETKYLMENRI